MKFLLPVFIAVFRLSSILGAMETQLLAEGGTSTLDLPNRAGPTSRHSVLSSVAAAVQHVSGYKLPLGPPGRNYGQSGVNENCKAQVRGFGHQKQFCGSCKLQQSNC